MIDCFSTDGNDRGVSEVIAFVLIFSIVITSVGLLYTAGFGSLTQIQESETDRSAQRAFGASASALEDIQRGRGEHRGFDLELSGRMLEINDSKSLGVDVDGSDVGSADGAIVYGGGSGTEIVYQSGAVIRSDGADSQIVSRPPLFRCTGDYAMVSMVTITGPSNPVAADGTIEIRADGPQVGNTTVVGEAQGSGSTVTIDYSNSGYTMAWGRYFEDHSEWSADRTAESATCTADRVFVRHVPIDLEYDNV